MVILLTKVFVFLFCLNFVSPWPTIYDEEDFETPLVDDVPSYFKDPFQDLISELGKTEENSSHILTSDDNEQTSNLSTTKVITTTTTPEPTTTIPKSCPAPDVTYNGSLLSTVQATFKDIHDVEFEVRTGPFPGDNQRCKLTCVKGQWVGPLCRTKENAEYKALMKSCELNIHPPNIFITYKYHQLKLRDSTLFPDGSSVEFRCDENHFTGYDFALEGNSTLTCHDGSWDRRIPFCRRTASDRGEYSEDMPPQLSLHVASGHASVGPAGEVLVYPGSIFHIDCLFDRRKGNPQWTLSKPGKKYATGWVVDTVNRDWHYRISVYYVGDEDTNSFTCRTPRGKTNSINVLVTDIECPEFDISDVELESRMDGRKIGAQVHFTCPRGFNLKGLNRLICQRNGVWSGETPHCQPVKCTALEILDAHLRVLSLNNSFQGEASFLCPFGYALVGPETIQCGPDGKWTGYVPKCKAISCPSPLPPLNGKVMDNGHYLVGNTVQYSCHEGYVLIGEPIIRCTETGLWSHAPPFCKRACRFPGDPKNGRITPVKFLYEVGDRILIQCDTGHINTGKQKLQCTQTGSWSDRLPTCLSYRN